MTKTGGKLRQGLSKNHKQQHNLIPNCLGYSVFHIERYMIFSHTHTKILYLFLICSFASGKSSLREKCLWFTVTGKSHVKDLVVVKQIFISCTVLIWK